MIEDVREAIRTAKYFVEVDFNGLNADLYSFDATQAVYDDSTKRWKITCTYKVNSTPHTAKIEIDVSGNVKSYNIIR
jgi:hypothetical protein